MAPVFEQFALADQFATSRGTKICVLTCNAAPVRVIPTKTPVSTPFEPGNFDKKYSARQNLVFCCSPEMEDYFKGLDSWAIDYITEHSERLLKKTLTREQVLEGYTPAISQRGKYPTQLKTKINMEGTNACKYWTSKGTKRGPPDSWRATECIPSLAIRYLWQMNGKFGWVVDVTDILVGEGEGTGGARQSPFTPDPSQD